MKWDGIGKIKGVKWSSMERSGVKCCGREYSGRVEQRGL